ncbi:MAG: DUF2490 domain-containing protein [Bacteroidetes bacterium]|nr:DUF2490 domain-containing protein [Bacteroidota bacterium]
MSKLKIFFIIITIIFSAYKVFAQTNDAQLWTDVKIDHKFNSNITAYIEGGLRFSENLSETGTAYSEIGMDYKLNKTWVLSGGYRYFSKRKNEDFYSIRHRFNLDVSFKKSYYLFTFQLRTRAEMEYKDILTSVKGMIPDYQWLNKVQVKYNFTKRIKPYLYLESYNSLSPSQKHTQFFDITKMRYCIGAEYKINKRKSFELYYLIQNEYHQKDPYNYFVTGLSYSFSF